MIILNISYSNVFEDNVFTTKQALFEDNQIDKAIQQLKEWRKYTSQPSYDVSYIHFENTSKRERSYVWTPFGEKTNDPAISQLLGPFYKG